MHVCVAVTSVNASVTKGMLLGRHVLTSIVRDCDRKKLMIDYMSKVFESVYCIYGIFQSLFRSALTFSYNIFKYNKSFAFCLVLLRRLDVC